MKTMYVRVYTVIYVRYATVISFNSDLLWISKSTTQYYRRALGPEGKFVFFILDTFLSRNIDFYNSNF